jgi:WD40 repeat protein
VAAGCKDGGVTAWDAVGGKQTWTSPTGHNGAVRVLAFSPRGDRIVTGGEDAVLIVRDARTGKELFREPAHQLAVSAVAFSPDGGRIVSGGADGGVRVWEAGADRLTLVTAIAAYPTPGGTNPYPGCVAFSPDGKLVVVGGSAESGYLPRPIQVWDAHSGARVQELAGPIGRTTSLTFDADGRLYSAGQDRIVRVWDLTDGKLLRTLKGHRSEVVRMTFSPDAQRLAVAARDGGVHLWHAGDGRPLVVLRDLFTPTAALSFSPDGNLLFAATPTEGVQVWDGTPCPPADSTLRVGIQGRSASVHP